MHAIWIWIIIAIVFGVLSGVIFNVVTRRHNNTIPQSKGNEDDTDTEMSATGSLLLTILVFSILAFLVVWLICAIIGINMHW